jgi:hypothetical protein
MTYPTLETMATITEYPLERSGVLVTFIISGVPSSSATIWEHKAQDDPYDFLSFLGLAQHFQINLLPLTWQPALDVVGVGATSQIRQSFLSLQMSFVFKRFAPSEISTNTDEERAFRALISEVSILGDPFVRHHPNIITLVGICWDVITDTGKVWPVLVFEKAQHGDLYKFMQTPRGVGLDFDKRLGLCADIATAIATMHAKGK